MIAKLFINGEWIESENKESIITPVKEEIEIHYAGWNEIELAITSALSGSKQMKKMSSFERSKVLKKIAEKINEKKEEFAAIITKESGKPISLSRLEVERAISTFNLAAEESKRIYGEIIPLDIESFSEGYRGYYYKFPIGVILAITPFNFPLNLVAHKIAPAIASGNSVILKPSPFTPCTACLLGEVILEAGLPKEAFNLIHASPSAAEQLVKDERIDMLTFTGSAAVGWYLKNICGKKKVILEMGGNAAAIVEEDADLEWAANRLALGAFAYSGQICISVQRIFVKANVLELFLDKFLMAVERIKIGDPFDELVLVGPMITKEAADKVESWIKDAWIEGAQFLMKGERVDNLITPYVLTHTSPSMKIWSEEVFGPVVLLETFLNFEEAIRMVNDSKYGLQAGIFTKNIKFIEEAIEEIEVGGLIINDYPTFRVDSMPYGGIKHSGFGKEGVKYSIEEMMNKKLVVIKPV